MTTLLIGDFRAKQLQQCSNKDDYIFITEDSAEYLWFQSSAINQLPLYALNKANVVIMLGFNDCVYSCIWETSFDLNSIVAKYIDTINALVTDYPNFTFYIGAVCPIDSNYPVSSHKDGVILQSVLTEKIKKFNADLAKGCPEVTFIDCYNYLAETGFSTRDGVRLLPDSCDFLSSYILSHMKTSTLQTNFQSRATPDMAPDPNDADSFLYWKHYTEGGYNRCINIVNSVLPNCTGYAWGRFMEILGSTPTLCLGNAGTWYNYMDGYDRGASPKLGAVMCWEKPGDAGHVAIVEQINPDGSIIISESGYRTENTKYDYKLNTLYPSTGVLGHFWVTTRAYDKDTFQWREVDEEGNFVAQDKDWIAKSTKGEPSYVFQGFIYNPKESEVGSRDNITKADTVSKSSGNITQIEMENNARYIWKTLSAEQWTLNAVAGILGNMQTESHFNPGIIERHSELKLPGDNATAAEIEDYANQYKAKKGRFPGYGLVQWTGLYAKDVENIWQNNKFIYWCDQRGLDPTDIDSQIKRIIWECENNQQFGWTSDYPMTFQEFVQSKKSARYLAEAFLRNYERPANPNYKIRGDQGEEWYDFLSQYSAEVEVEPPLILDNLKATIISPTTAEISWIARKDGESQYKILDQSKNIVAEGKLTADSEETDVNIRSFNCDKLTPNTSYTAEIETSTGADKLVLSTSFDTPQSLPESINTVMLLSKDTKLPYDNFQLTVSPAKPDFGYWTTGTGYDIQLIVNGKVKDKKFEETLPKTLKLSEYFNYKSKLGDIIQIGIRTRTKYNNEPLYDSDFAKVSNPVCMLTKPITAYLNIN